MVLKELRLKENQMISMISGRQTNLLRLLQAIQVGHFGGKMKLTKYLQENLTTHNYLKIKRKALKD